MRARATTQAEEQAEDGQGETLRERGAGGTLYSQQAAATTTLRPQQSRNVIWRWQLRRRQRSR